MEALFARLADSVALLIEAAAVVVVTYGAIEAFAKLVRIMTVPRSTHGARKAVWRPFGVWLLLGLEFELAADIIVTVVSPTWMDIGELAAVAVILHF